MKEIIQKALAKSISFEAYENRHEQLIAEGKTTGENQMELLVSFTKLNLNRTKRVLKKMTVLESAQKALSSLTKKETWLIISEPWCGDAAQTVPVFYNLSQQNPLIDFKMVYRDEHPELMSHFLTDGGSAIPIVIFIDSETDEVKGSWGPRPEQAQQMVRDYKALEVKPPYQELAEDMQKWYNSDKTVNTQKEFVEGWLARKH